MNEMQSSEYICPLFHERLVYFVCQDVFNKDELENENYIKKYNLNDKFRDIKYIKANQFPAGYPVEKVNFDKDGYAALISIRAMHRIACADLFGDNIHFMFNNFVKWKILNYDNSTGGSLIKFVIHDKSIPVKYIADIKLAREKDPIRVQVLHIQSVWNLEKEPCFLVYYIIETDEGSRLDSAYIENFNYITLYPVIMKKG